MNKYS